jgi:signal transduction histidine kinase/CheY-like chemotaxis protein
LRAYFALPVAVFAATAVGAIVYVSVQSGRDQRSQAVSAARFAARTAAGELGSAVKTLRATVRSVASAPGIERALTDPQQCTLQFQASGGMTGHIDILRDDGSVACSSRGRSGGGYGAAAWLGRARSQPLMRAPVADPPVGGHAALATAPMHGGVVAAFLALESTGPGLERLYGGGRPAEFVVTAPGGTVIARSIAPARWIGRSLQGSGFARAAGHVTRPDADGVRRLYADAPVPGTSWTFSVGEDRHAALAAARRLRDRQLLIVLGGLVLMLLAAVAVYHRVARPVGRLGAAVRSSSGESPPVAVADPGGPAEVTALATDVNALIGAVERELGERRRAEEAARASERNYRLLFEASPVAMWIADRETQEIVAVNDAALALYGYERDELLGRTAADLGAGGGTPGDEPVAHRRADGSAVQVQVATHAVTFRDRPATFTLAVDVRERERLEAQLRQAQRMEAIGRLAGGVAHDFNNLLTAILGHTDLLVSQLEPGDPRRDEADLVKQAGERAAALTRQLLTLGRGQGGEPQVVDLNATVRGLEPMLRRLIRSDIEIVTSLSPGAPALRADRGQLEQVVVNLVANAGDAMPGGGRLTIATGEAELDEAYARLHPTGPAAPGRYAVLEVSDSGLGMDAETLAHVFEPFFTTKGDERGTGLGLTTVYGIVRQSGGFVWPYSEPGRGTTFKAYFPLVAAAASASASPQRPERTLTGGARTVLLAEDDPAVRAIVRRMLESHGFAIVEAARGDEALRLGEARPAGSLHVLVTDTVMPGPGGTELAGRLRRHHPELRTLIMSGYGEPAAAERPLGPATEFIAKPFSAADLQAKLAALLDG